MMGYYRAKGKTDGTAEMGACWHQGRWSLLDRLGGPVPLFLTCQLSSVGEGSLRSVLSHGMEPRNPVQWTFLEQE